MNTIRDEAAVDPHAGTIGRDKPAAIVIENAICHHIRRTTNLTKLVELRVPTEIWTVLQSDLISYFGEQLVFDKRFRADPDTFTYGAVRFRRDDAI